MEILKLVLLLSSLRLSAEGRPLSAGCSQTSEIEQYDPTNPGAETTCVKCPECPKGQGLSPQCGSRVSKNTKIECIQCQENVTYSNSHGIESCKACQECGLKNVIQHCTTDRNRICGDKCPQGHFLDHNDICQECYFCCDSVSEAQRRQGCKRIGMSKDWQCEKTEQNQRCYEALEKVTTLPTHTKPHGAVSLGAVLGGVASFIVIISVFVLIAIKTGIRECFGFSRTNNSETADKEEEDEQQEQEQVDTNAENIPAGISGLALSELSPTLESELIKRLDVRHKGEYGWKKLGNAFEVDKDELKYLETAYQRIVGSPTKELLEILDKNQRRTVGEVLNKLKGSYVNRPDVARLICQKWQEIKYSQAVKNS